MLKQEKSLKDTWVVYLATLKKVEILNDPAVHEEDAAVVLAVLDKIIEGKTK